jgi:hypothetical protein
MFCPRCGHRNSGSGERCEMCHGPMPDEASTQGQGNQAGDFQPVRISNNLVWAILSTLFCCLPLGIVAIVYAAQVDSKLAAGDIAGARQSAQSAATWSWVSFGLGILSGLIFAGLAAMGRGVGH